VKKFLAVLAFSVSAVVFLAGFTAPPSKNELSDGQLHLPIVMYHNVLKSRTGKYVVSPAQLERDFEAIIAAGFQPVFMSEVIDWVDGKGKLPARPIVITFDDGHYNNLHYGLPIAQRHNMKFMINPVTSFSKFSVDSGDHSNPNYSHITWEQMGTAVASGLIEFGNHSHAMHKFKPRFGITKMRHEGEDDYATTLRDDIMAAQDLIEQSGAVRPRTFAYPFGKFDSLSRRLLLDMEFRALLTCTEGVSIITKSKPESLHNLKRINRDGSMSTEKLINLVCKK